MATRAPNPHREALADHEAAELVTRFQNGDRGAFEALYIGYFDAVYAYLRIVLRDDHEAEDAAQQVFTSALASLHRYRPSGAPFRAWLFRIARNHGLKTRARLERAQPTPPELLQEQPARGSVEPAPGDGVRTLLQALDVLPDSQRQILLLRFAFDFSSAESGAIVGKSAAAVRQLQRRGIKTLRTRLAPLRVVASAPAPRPPRGPHARRLGLVEARAA